MKSKKLLVALAMPMLFAACSQEELAIVDNSVKVDLSNRAVVANVGLNLGVDSRLSVQEGAVYAAQWDENDGVGACIIDAPTYTSYPTANQIAQNGIKSYYKLTDYISSNYKYSKGENGVWATQALMVEGNYMFYAPHSESFLTRMPVVASFPTVQNIDPEAEVRNSSIQDFYQSGNPVVVGYEFLSAANQDATVSPKLYNIYAYPKFTLKNSYKDENGVAQDLNISKIVIKQNSGKFVSKAYISNENLNKNLTKINNEIRWDAKRIETAATSDIFGNTVAQADEITVNFGEGLTVAAGEKEEFFIVLPAEDYRSKNNNQLTVEIYTTDDMMFATPFTLKSFVLNPGNAYPAEEYNTKTQTLKASKGTLATIDMKGSLIDLNAKNTGIKNNAELINYITNVAKRFDDIREVNNTFVLNNTFDAYDYRKELAKDENSKYYYQYNPQIHFTLDDDAEIVIDDELIEVLIDQLGDADLNPTQTTPEITFLGESLESGKIKLGNLTKYADFAINFDGKVSTIKHSFEVEEEEFAWYAYLQNAKPEMAFEIEGEAELKGELAFTSVVVPEGSSLTLSEDLVAPALYVQNYGTVTYEGGIVAYIGNGADNEDDADLDDVLYMNASSENISIGNMGTMYVAGGDVNTIVTVGGTVANAPWAVINNEGILADVMNFGTINVNAANSTTIAQFGTINNVKMGTVTATDADVIATLATVPGEYTQLEEKWGINHIIFTSDVKISATAWTDYMKGANLKVVEFNGSLITPVSFDAPNATFKFNSTSNWGGSEVGATPNVTVGKVQVKSGKTVKVNYLNVVTGAKSGNFVEGNNGSITVVQ